MSMKSLLIVAAAGAIGLTAGVANATIGSYTTALAYQTAVGGNGLGVSDPVDWATFSAAQGNTPGVTNNYNNTSFTSGAALTTGIVGSTGTDEVVTATNGANSQFAVYNNGQSSGLANTRWDGDFASGVNVLSTGSTSITLSFSGAVTGLGIDAQTANSGAYTVTMDAYNSSHTLLSASTCNSGTCSAANSATSSGRASDNFGSAAFLGVTSTAGDISYVTITISGTPAVTSGGFAIDTALVYHFSNVQTGGGGTQTPEPGTLGLLGAGLAALGWVRRRRNRAA